LINNHVSQMLTKLEDRIFHQQLNDHACLQASQEENTIPWPKILDTSLTIIYRFKSKIDLCAFIVNYLLFQEFLKFMYYNADNQ